MTQPDQTLTEKPSNDRCDCGSEHAVHPTPEQVHSKLAQEIADDVDAAVIEAVTKSNATKTVSGTYAQMLGMTLQASLQEITEYTNLIKTAKTQAKKDFYQRKIKKIAKRLQRIVPSAQ